MTAITYAPSARADGTSARRFPLAPAEGWTTLGLVLLLCLTLAWSIDDASWVVGPRGLTDFLAWAVALGVGWGFLSAKVGWSRWQAHLLGATFAGLILPMIVGARLMVGGGPVDWFRATAASCVDAYFDLTYRGLQFTTEIGHFLLILGAIAWATGQFASYATFHHRRPLNAVLIIGLGLVANMSLTLRDQLPYLVIYSLSALFLLIRFHAYDERTLWIRHRIGDANALGGLYLRGGTVFVASAVLASLFLTATATSAPLASAWKGADQKLIALGQEFQRVFRGGGQGTRINAVDFTGSAVIAGRWTTNSDPVLEVRVPDDGRYFWRAVVYDRFDGHGWSWSPPTETQLAAGAGVLSESADNPLALAGRREVTFAVRELDFNPKAMFAPDMPAKSDVETTVTTVGSGAQSYFGGMTSDATSYQITAMVPIDGQVDPVKGLTANKLKVAGTGYPDAIKQLYLGVEPNVGGPHTDALLAAILTRHPEAKASPYDLARAITTYLTTEGGFIYDDNVLDIDCGRMSAVECFALSKHGYCEHYASTMAILLRMSGVPARVAEGFLPSVPVAGVETILKSASHAWVEVYFPGYGWVTFDPTGGGIGQDRPLPQGPRVSAPPATPRASPGASNDDANPRRSVGPPSIDPNASAGGTTSGRGPGSGPLIVIGLLLAIAMGGLAFIAWQRGPRTISEPDAVWRGVVGLARRLGFAPRPSQTVFEYSGSLGEILPNARPDLQTVARAKVEVAYGRGQLGDDRLRSLRDAQRRLRVALLRLVLRRRERRERKGRRR
ncbi:MAG: transglutaminaseTgpA domain-containing protein [Chloroflexota bacterium]